MARYKTFASLLLLSVVVAMQPSRAQNVEVQLLKKGYSREALAVRLVTDTSICKNIPFKTFPYWSLRRVAIDPLQATYERVIDRKMTQVDWNWFANEYKVDTTRISKKKVVKNYIYIATGIDSNGIKYISIDSDNNKDFSEERIFNFDLKNSQKIYPEVLASIEYFDGRSIKNATIPVMLDAYAVIFPGSYSGKMDKELDMTLMKLYSIYEGKLKIEKEEYNISVFNRKQEFETPVFEIEVQKVEANTGSFMKFTYTSKDTISIRYKRYKFNDFRQGKLKLTYLGINNFAGAEVNTLAPPIEEVELITNSPFSLKKYLGKYVLIDFWGSWCMPCIKAIPDLKNTYQQFQGKVEFLSVGYDKLEDKKKLETLINQNAMTWHHVFDNMDSGKQSISTAYKVQSFPTTILIDPKGKVVFRSVAKEGLESAAQYLNTVFKAK